MVQGLRREEHRGVGGARLGDRVDSPGVRLEEVVEISSRMLGEKETKWAIGGAALGLTVAIVEYIANNVFDNR